MPTLEFTNDQLYQFVEQLQPAQQKTLYQYLGEKVWSKWLELSRYGENRIREIAVRYNLDWDKLSEEERETFIDHLVHEDRP